MSNTETKLSFNWLVINSILLVILIFSIIFWFYPEYSDVEAKKVNFSETLEKYKNMEKNWIDFSILKTNAIDQLREEKKKWKNKKEEVIANLEILKNSESTFDNLLKEKRNTKNTSKKFIDFLDEKELKIKEQVNSKQNIILEKKIENILPSYIEKDETISTLTNFKFINYLENLFFAFNLKNDWALWIGNIVAIDNLWKNKVKADQIFYIPIKLKLEWKKGNIINFLYYIENVWRIELKKGEKLEIDFKNNDFFDDNYNVKKYLANSKIYNFEENNEENNDNKNIYNNLFADIEEIKFPKYPDRKLEEHSSNSELSFIKYLQKDQFIDEYKLNLTVKFYVKWLPRYKLTEEIVWLISKFSKVSKEIEVELKKQETKKLENRDIVNYSKLFSLKKYLNKKKKDVVNLKKSLKKEKDLIKVYNSTKEINEKLEEAKNIFEEIKKKTVKKVKNKN